MNFFTKAAQSLPGHWYKGDYTDGQGNYCAAGHMLKAMGWSDHEIRTGTAEEGGEESIATKIINSVTGELFPDRVTPGNPMVAYFNDHPDTTEEDVISVFEKSAVRWDERI